MSLTWVLACRILAREFTITLLQVAITLRLRSHLSKFRIELETLHHTYTYAALIVLLNYEGNNFGARGAHSQVKKLLTLSPVLHARVSPTEI